MDPFSHSVMGTSIALIAINTPVLASEQMAIPLTFAFTIIASNLPDIDVITKLFGNKTYINQHRGITHSIIVFNILALLLNVIANIFLAQIDLNSNILLPWIFIGVYLHIITDLFNNYGVKIFWPFIDKWYSINATYTIDTVIIASNIIGIVLHLLLDLNPIYLFSSILILDLVYLIVLAIYRRYLIHLIRRKLKNVKHVYLASKPIPSQWKFVAELENGIFKIGILTGHKVTIYETQKKQLKIDEDLFKIIKNDQNFIIFKKFAKVYNWDVRNYDDYTEIRLKDLSYYVKINNKFVYVFNAVIYVNNKKKEITHSYVGFTTGDDYLYKMVEQPFSLKKVYRKFRKVKIHE